MDALSHNPRVTKWGFGQNRPKFFKIVYPSFGQGVFVCYRVGWLTGLIKLCRATW